MKKFYLNNGTDQQGPFDIEDLKSKSIKKETPIWYEGLNEWTTAKEIDELKDLFKTANPPPFGGKTNNSIPVQKSPDHQTLSPKQSTIKKSKTGKVVFILAGLLVVVIIGLWVASIDSSNGRGTGVDTYHEKIMTIEEIESSQPTKFLSASGNYNENFWGDFIKVHGVISNIATVASYKDAVVKVTYYSKTKTELGSKEYTIYDNFPPHSEIKFELKIENYKDVDTIGWDVIQATAN